MSIPAALRESPEGRRPDFPASHCAYFNSTRASISSARGDLY